MVLVVSLLITISAFLLVSFPQVSPRHLLQIPENETSIHLFEAQMNERIELASRFNRYLAEKRAKHPPGVGKHPPSVGKHPPGVGKHPPGVGKHFPKSMPPRKRGRHPRGVGKHPPGVGRHPPGVGRHPKCLSSTGGGFFLSVCNRPSYCCGPTRNESICWGACGNGDRCCGLGNFEETCCGGKCCKLANCCINQTTGMDVCCEEGKNCCN